MTQMNLYAAASTLKAEHDGISLRHMRPWCSVFLTANEAFVVDAVGAEVQ